MNRPTNHPTKKNPNGGNRWGSDTIANLTGLYGTPKTTSTRTTRKGWHEPTLPTNWRDRLPDPASYYPAHVAKLGRTNANGYAQGQCPFHEDHNASLSVHVTEGGGWTCFSGCGKGDLLGFHMRLTGKPFKDAVADLVRWHA